MGCGISSLLTALMAASTQDRRIYSATLCSVVVSGAAQNPREALQGSPALFRVSTLHLSVCHGSLEVSQCPMDGAELQNFSIFFI